MAESLLLFTSYYLFLLLILVFFFVIGHILHKGVKAHLILKGFYSKVFIKILSGVFFCVTGYSLWKTSGKTINLAIVLVFCFLLWELRQYVGRNKQAICITVAPEEEMAGSGSWFRKLLPLLPVSLGIYTWFACLILHFHGEFRFILNCNPGASYFDKIYYSNISLMLGQTGQENRFLVQNMLSPAYHGMEPYHYFELWLNALFTVPFHTLNFVSLYLLTYPFLTILIVLGMVALVERITRISFLVWISCLAFLFVGGLYFHDIFVESPFLIGSGEAPMEFSGEKFSVHYSILLACMLFYVSGYIPLAITSILFLPVMSIGSMPGVVSGITVFLVISVIMKRITKMEFLRLFGYLAGLLLFIAWIYSHWGVTAMSPYMHKQLVDYMDWAGEGFRSLKIFLVELVYRIIRIPLITILLYAPFLGIAGLWFFQKIKNDSSRSILYLSLLIYAGSLLAYGTFYKFFDASQFYSNNYTFLHVVLMVGLIHYFFTPSSGRLYLPVVRKSLLFGMILLLSVKAVYAFTAHRKYIDPSNGSYSEKYLLDIQNMNQGKKERALVAALQVEDSYDLDKSGVSCPYLVYMPQFYPCVTMNDLKNPAWNTDPDEARFQQEAVKHAAFFQFVEAQKRNHRFVSFEQSQVDFLDHFHFQYLVIAKGVALGEPLKSRIGKCLTDEVSGERFVELK
jgi:hypothetical protein